MQGGTNEMVAHSVYKQLTDEEKKFMHFYWYTGKDMTRPINGKYKQRSCHSKYRLSTHLASTNAKGI